MKAKIIEVMIVWSNSKESFDEGIVHVLTSHAGTRVYEKDKLDSRLTMTQDFGETLTLPFADNWQQAHKFMTYNPGKQLQITTKLGKMLKLF